MDNSTIYLVDTPGFDDTHRTDYQVFMMISTWLIETYVSFSEYSCSTLICSSISYSRQIGLAGLLYFHRISDNRMSGMPLCNLHNFQRLCESELDRVVLTTTMWDQVNEATGISRENELKEIYWSPLINCGSSVKRFLNNRQSGVDILQPIIQGASSRSTPQNTADRISSIRQFLNNYAVGPVQRFQGRAVTAIADIWRSRLPRRIFM